jgi:NADH-quinone oxidoreductase subunit L
MINFAWLVPLLPGVAFAIIGLFTRKSRSISLLLSLAAIGVSTLLAYSSFFELLGGARPAPVRLPWIEIGKMGDLNFGWQVDSLTGIMLVVVTTVALLVQVYSIGYMHDDPGFGRFYAYLSLFSAAMLGLVLASNLLTIYIFWEGVGLGSFLLIGFWYGNRSATEEARLGLETSSAEEADEHKAIHSPTRLILPVDERPSPAEAAKKAFLTTRLGDFGMLIGILLFWVMTVANGHGTLEFSELAERAEHGQFNSGLLALACILLFCGAIGKSAQFPLHVWLPDAMEGPTPVSALIHAATMVAAGVYLVARAFPIFEASPTALYFVAGIGGFTAIFAATMGLVSFDLKRVMAYSTVSQLGYMMLGLGSGALSAGIFHLFTHAFFKALLFLTAGSVLHALHNYHTQDMRDMGGLRKRLPITFICMLIAALSLAGIPPLSGFWSKDLILTSALTRAQESPEGTGFYFYFAFALITVFLTAFYMFRVLFLTFFGELRLHEDPHHPIRESPAVMTVPLLVLAVPSVLVGLWGSPVMGDGFQRFLDGAAYHEEVLNWGLAGLGAVVAIAGMVLAYLMYYARAISPELITGMLRPFYTLATNKYYLDRLYEWLIGTVVLGFGRFLAYVFDPKVVDGVVNGVGRLTIAVGAAARQVQTGRVQAYAMVIFFGLFLISLLSIISGNAQR